MRRLACILLAAAGLVAGCGKQPSPAPAPAAASPTAAAPNLVVTQDGSALEKTVWYARIETLDANPIFETAFHTGPIAFSRRLPPGKYRLISWYRACEQECPSSGEKGLGPLEDVCGAPFTVTAESSVTMAVVIDAEGACSIRTQ